MSRAVTKTTSLNGRSAVSWPTSARSSAGWFAIVVSVTCWSTCVFVDVSSPTVSISLVAAPLRVAICATWSTSPGIVAEKSSV